MKNIYLCLLFLFSIPLFAQVFAQDISSEEGNDSTSFIEKEVQFRKIERWVRWRNLGLDKWNIDNIYTEAIKLLEEDILREKRRVFTLVRFKVLSQEQGDFLDELIDSQLESYVPKMWLLYHKQRVRDNREEMAFLNEEVERLYQEEKALRKKASKLRPKLRQELFDKGRKLIKQAEEMQKRHDKLKKENKTIKKQYRHGFSSLYKSYEAKER